MCGASMGAELGLLRGLPLLHLDARVVCVFVCGVCACAGCGVHMRHMTLQCMGSGVGSCWWLHLAMLSDDGSDNIEP